MMDQPNEPAGLLKKGDIVQLHPDYHPVFAACLMIVSETSKWGAVGYVLIPQEGGAGRAYIRVPTDQMVKVGEVVWLPFDELDAVSHGIVGHA